ncbi:MAG: hypothetical protein HY810_10015 [Candidatus Omnitrophica bacterium]|nr:hypothetical protein [Candidatus Omnitrophota bacterium]
MIILKQKNNSLLLRFCAFLVMQVFLFTNITWAGGGFDIKSTLSPQVQIDAFALKNQFQGITNFERENYYKWPELSNAGIRAIISSTLAKHELTPQVLNVRLMRRHFPGLYEHFNMIKKAQRKTESDVVSFMLEQLGFDQRVPFWKKGERGKAIRFLKERIIPFLQEYQYNPYDNSFEKRDIRFTEMDLVTKGELYFSCFSDAAFSALMYQKLNIATSGIANTVAENALNFGQMVAEATEDERINAELVVRLFTWRDVMPKIEEIYKYEPYLRELSIRQTQISRLARIIQFYNKSKTDNVLQTDKEFIEDVNNVYSLLRKNLPSPDFLFMVKQILSLKDWLIDADYLNAQEKALIDGLDVFWPKQQVRAYALKAQLEQSGSGITSFYQDKIIPVSDYLNSRLWQWQGRRVSGEWNYLKMLQRSAGWFSVLGTVDWINERMGAIKGLKVADLDSFYSGVYLGFEKKSQGKAVSRIADITDVVCSPRGLLIATNPDVLLSQERSPISLGPELFDAVTSIFNLHKLDQENLFHAFKQANEVLKLNGYFVVTVPHNKELSASAVEFIEKNLGFKLTVEQLAMQRVKDIYKIRGEDDKEAISEAVKKRKFYFMVFQKESNVITDVAGISGQLKELRFLDIELNEQLSVFEIGKGVQAQDQELNLRKTLAQIETVDPNNLELVFLKGRFGNKKIISSQKIKSMLTDVFRFQNLIYGVLLDEGTEKAEKNFSRLQELLDRKYKILMHAGDDELKNIEYYEIEEIESFYYYLVGLLKNIYELDEGGNFLEVLESIFNFLRINRDFLREDEADIIGKAKELWGNGVIDESEYAKESTRELVRNVLKIQGQIKALEKELVDIVNRWGAPEGNVCIDAAFKEFWPLIRQTKAWLALQHVIGKYSVAGKNIYLSRMSLLEERIFDKIFSIPRNRAAALMEMPKDKAANMFAQTGDFIFSVFDLDSKGEIFLLDNDLEDARKILKTKGKLVIILPNDDKIIGQCEGAMKGYGFFIKKNFIGDNFYIIEADKGGRVGDTLARLRQMRESNDFLEGDIDFLNNLWKDVFERYGLDISDGLKMNIQQFIGALPEDFHFRIMIAQMAEVYLEKVSSGKKFIDLSRLEHALVELNNFNEWGFQLYDKPGADNGLFFHDKEGRRINLFSFFQEQSLLIRLEKFTEEINQFSVSVSGAAPAYEARCRKIIENFSLTQKIDAGIIYHLDDVDALFKQMGMDDCDPQEMAETIEGILTGLLSCPEKELGGLWQQAEEYLLAKDRILKTIIFKIILEKKYYDYDWSRSQEIRTRFRDIRAITMASPERNYLSVQMRILFNLNQWMDRIKDDKDYAFLLMTEINAVFGLIYKNTGNRTVAQNMLTLPWYPARYYYRQFFLRGLSARDEHLEIFKSLAAEIFNSSDCIFYYNYMHWLMAIKYSQPKDREVYLKVLGRVIGYIKEQMRTKISSKKIERALKPYQKLFAGAGYEVSFAPNSAWLENKVRISNKLTQIIFTPSEQKIIEDAQKNPFGIDEIDLFFPESVGPIFNEVVEEGPEYYDVKEYRTILKSAFLRRELLPGLVFSQVDVSTRQIIKRLFQDISCQVKSMFEYALILNAANGYGKETGKGASNNYGMLLSDQLMSLVKPGEDFAGFLEAVYNYQEVVVEITENRPEIFNEVLKLFNSEDFYEATIALKFVKRYSEFKGQDIKSKVLTSVWETILTGENLTPSARLKRKIATFAVIFDLKRNAHMRDAVLQTYKSIRSKYSDDKARVFDWFLKDIFTNSQISMQGYDFEKIPLGKINQLHKLLIVETSI